MHLKLILTAGLAMFSMFFGSGNLVFPVHLGVLSVGQYPMAALGIFITAIIVPFIGLVSMINFEGSRNEYFERIGKIPALILMLMMLGLMGPFGVGARCIIVAFGGIELFAKGLPFAVFAFLFCLLVFLICWKKSYVVTILGRFLTPILLLGLALIIGLGVTSFNEIEEMTMSGFDSFKLGLDKGYQMMDLLAAFFFSATIKEYLSSMREKGMGKKSVALVGLSSSVMAMLLLAIVYFGLQVIGAKYHGELLQVKPEEMLVTIAGLVLGKMAMPVTGLTFAVACLTTLVVLTNLFSDFLRKDLWQKKIGHVSSLLITLVITMTVSLVGFSALANYIHFALTYAYPALIVLAAASLFQKKGEGHVVKWSFWGGLLLFIFGSNIFS